MLNNVRRAALFITLLLTLMNPYFFIVPLICCYLSAEKGGAL